MTDTERYQLLSRLVDDGDWAVARVEIIDKFGNVKMHYMDDKIQMDAELDKA